MVLHNLVGVLGNANFFRFQLLKMKRQKQVRYSARDIKERDASLLSQQKLENQDRSEFTPNCPLAYGTGPFKSSAYIDQTGKE